MTALRMSISRTGMAQSLDEIDELLTAKLVEDLCGPDPRSGEGLLEAEARYRRVGGVLSDLMTMRAIVEAHLDDAFVEGAVVEVREECGTDGQGNRLWSRGWERTSVLLPHGSVLSIQTPYLRPRGGSKVGRPRGNGRRREAGAGAFPVLEKLGITDGVTPLARSDIALQTVLCGSYEEAVVQLGRQGLSLDVSTLVRVAVATGTEALRRREEVLSAARTDGLPDDPLVKDLRIRVSVDGGRSRTRQTNKRGRKKKNGRRGAKYVWKEPRMITVDVLNEEGEIDRERRPIYEVTIDEADKVFEDLTGLLRAIGAHAAKEVIFVSDGAEWIWNRLDKLIAEAQIPAERVRRVLDFYHACEHIWNACKACSNMSTDVQRARYKKLRKILLKPDGVVKVIAKLRALARGRRAPKINEQISYLETHQEHMRYAELKTAKCPIGSGVVESAIRRVINLRFKSAGQCWTERNLAPLLYLRATLKSGRWDDLLQALLSGRHWLQPRTAATPQTADDWRLAAA